MALCSSCLAQLAIMRRHCRVALVTLTGIHLSVQHSDIRTGSTGDELGDSSNIIDRSMDLDPDLNCRHKRQNGTNTLFCEYLSSSDLGAKSPPRCAPRHMDVLVRLLAIVVNMIWPPEDKAKGIMAHTAARITMPFSSTPVSSPASERGKRVYNVGSSFSQKYKNSDDTRFT